MLYEIQIFARDCHKIFCFIAEGSDAESQRTQWLELCRALSRLLRQEFTLPTDDTLVEQLFVVFLKKIPYLEVLSRLKPHLSPATFALLEASVLENTPVI